MRHTNASSWRVGLPTLAAMVLVLGGGQSEGQTIAAPFAGSYSLTDLGPVAGVTTPYGGLTALAGDANTLLLGGSANNGGGGIYSVGVTRDVNGHITGFSGPGSLFATAPQIDGGLAYGPGGVLFYTGYPNNVVGEIKSGSSSTDKTVSLSGLGYSSSVGSLAFVPSYAPGAGLLKILSYNTGNFYDAPITPDGSGTYDIGTGTLQATLSGNPEGFVYVTPSSAVFSGPSMLVSEYGSGDVGAYSVDANGNPIAGTRQNFITGLSGAEGAFIDPLTGDFLFSTFGGGNHLIEVRGFASVVPEPGSLVLCGTAGMILLVVARVRRKQIATS